MSGRLTQAVALFVFALLVAAAAAVGSMFMPGAWYASLAKPSWTPPNAVFGPVWTVLYVMIAVAGWLVWRAGDRGLALAAWAVALVLNASWSWLFFGRQAMGLAFLDIVILWCAIALFVAAARRSSALASLLFVPYLVWVTFAAALNLAIWRLNA